ncbi:MAG: HAMP domain-containing protein, partial [Micrococcales bacterium]|nr:HAMP domain-containing protein [Micrococcales bacterium]
MHAAFEKWWSGISLRTKITGVTVLLLTFGLAVAGVGTANVLRIYLDQQDSDKVSSLASGLDGATDDQVLGCQVDYSRQGTLFEVLDASGNRICSNVAVKTGPDNASLDLQWASANKGQIVIIADISGRQHWRVVPQFWKPNDLSGQVYTVVIGITTKDTEALVGRYSAIFLGFAIAVIVLGAALTQLLVTSTFAPLRDVERTAARFAAGDYSQRLGGATPNTEVGRLNRSLNTMLARIDMAFADRARTIEQMRRFVGDASHELRTPLVSLRGYAELYRMGAIQKPEDVAQAMDRIEKEAIRMTGLVQDLLELARLD